MNNISGLFLRLEGVAGATIGQCAAGMCRVADMLGLMVEVNFNGVQLLATPGRQPESIVEEYRKRVLLQREEDRTRGIDND